MYVYIRNKPTEYPQYKYDVGFYDPDGKWISESCHTSTKDAARRVSFLNGGKE